MDSDSERKYRRPESVLVVVHTTDYKTLLLKRTPPRSFWQSITGSMKWQGESKIQTAIRELQEETGIVARLDELRDWNRVFRYTIPPVLRYRYDKDVQLNREHVFSILISETKPVILQHSEHIEYCWVDFWTAQDMVWSWSNREALEMIMSAGNQAQE